jgi:hypothetical protein
MAFQDVDGRPYLAKQVSMMKRPMIVTFVLWSVLFFSAWNALKAWTAIAWRDVLLEYSAQMPPTLTAGMSLLWFIIGMVAAWGIWQKKTWSAKWLPGAAAGYTAWYWVERLVWQNPRPNTVFAILATLAGLLLVIIASKSLSREAYERNTENQATE